MYQDGSIMWSKPFWCRTLFTIYYPMEIFSYSIFFQAKCIYNIHTYQMFKFDSKKALTPL